MSNLSAEIFEEQVPPCPSTPEALYQLGLIYALGRGVEQNRVTAHKWFNLAAVQGCSRARAEREALASEMSRQEVVEAQRQARDWVARAH